MVRGRGEGSIAKDEKTGLWVGRIELPSHELDENGNPKRRRKVVRRKDKNELIRELNKIKSDLERRGDLHTASQTTGSWLRFWVEEIAPKDRRPATMRSYQSIVTQHLIPSIGRVRLDQLTAQHIRTMLTKMKTGGASPTYIRNAFSVASAALKTAEREGRITRNPCDLIDPPRKGRTELQVLTTEEAAQLVASFGELAEACMWATFILTGARRGEILGLEWDRITDEIDLSWQLQILILDHGCGTKTDSERTWPCGYQYAGYCPKRHLNVPADYEYRHINGSLYWTRPKSNAGWRVIPLVEPLRSILHRLREASPPNPYGLVFTQKNGDPIYPDKATVMWPKVLKAAGIDKKVRLHDLRHGTVDLLLESGVPEEVVQLIVGHSNRAMTRAYRSKSNHTRVTEAMNMLSAKLGYKALEQ